MIGSFDDPVGPKPATRLSRKDWLSRSSGAVLRSVPGVRHVQRGRKGKRNLPNVYRSLLRTQQRSQHSTLRQKSETPIEQGVPIVIEQGVPIVIEQGVPIVTSTETST